MIRKIFNWQIIGAVIVLDQLSKWLAGKFFPETIIKNSGLPFGIYIPASPASGPEFFILPIVSVILLIFIFTAPKFFPENPAALSFIIGGAITNLADRLMFGYVRDVIDLGIGTANLADLAIWFGIGMLLFRVKRNINLRIRTNDTNPPEAD